MSHSRTVKSVLDARTAKKEPAFMGDHDTQSKGFVLPLTIWVIAAAGLAVAVLSEWVSMAVNNAQVLQRKVDSELAFINIRNELVFVLARRPYSYRGLQVGEFSNTTIGTTFDDLMNMDVTTDRLIFLDGRPYTMSSDERYIVKVQDGRGLINLNTINGTFLENFFDSLDVPDNSRDLLRDSLLDYRDEDSFNRLSGAERDDYIRQNLYPPSNYQLLTPWEAQRVFGWTQMSKLWKAQYESPLVTTCRSSGFNPNTASPEALSTYLRGVSLERASVILDFRQTAYFRNARELGDVAGVLLTNQPFFFSFIPGRCLIVDLIEKQSNEHIRFSLTLLPRNPTQPWQIDYVLRVPQEYGRETNQVDPENTFPSPEEIGGIARGAETVTGF